MKFGQYCFKTLVLLTLSLGTTQAVAQQFNYIYGEHNDLNGNGTVNAGDTITFYFEVFNDDYYGYLENVVLNPGNPAVTVSPSTILQIDSRSYGNFEGSYTVTQADVDAGPGDSQGYVELTNPSISGRYCNDGCQSFNVPYEYGSYTKDWQNPQVEFTVTKEFSDNNTGQVLVTLSCTDADIVDATLNAAEGSPAVFFLNNVGNNNTCTATESEVPGYTHDNPGDCQAVPAQGVGGGDDREFLSGAERSGQEIAQPQVVSFYGCGIHNEKNPATAYLVVQKKFTNGENIPVLITLECTDAVIKDNTLTANPDTVFELGDVEEGNECTATETVPEGYLLAESECEGIAVGPYETKFCDIINAPIPAESNFTVNKVFTDESPAEVQVTLQCEGATVDSATKPASMDSPAEFMLSNIEDGAQCTATEAVPEGYMADQTQCANVAVSSSDVGSECTITNTPIPPPTESTLIVSKVFTDESAAAVQVTLQCMGATVDSATKPASMGSPAEFMLSNITDGAQCTATESVPEGYMADQSQCANVVVMPDTVNGCTITNTPIPPPPETTFTVNKVYSDDTTTPVDITLKCTVADPANSIKQASPGNPAVFELTNVGSDNRCTATEEVPDGYESDESLCDNVEVAPGSNNNCTISNSLAGPPIGNPGPQRPANQQAIVDVINESCPKGDNPADFQALCTAMVVAWNNEEFVAAENSFKQTTADDAAAARSSGMQTANIQVGAVDGRIGTLRGGGGSGFTASGFSMGFGDASISGGLLKSFISAFDQNSPEFMQANATANDDQFIDEFGRWGAWISGRVIFGKKDPTLDQLEYDFDTAGLTFGMDYRFNDNFVAGLAVGYANTDADLGSDDGKMETKGYSVSLYGSWFKGDSFYMGGSIGYGDNDYDLTRIVSYSLAKPITSDPGINSLPDWAFEVDQTLGAEYSGDQFSAAISGGWDINKNGWTFGPTFRIDWVTVNVDAYDENLLNAPAGSGAQFGWAVHIDKQKYESLQPAIGFAFSKAVSRPWGVFIPQGYIDIVSEVKDGGILVNGKFRGDKYQVPFALQTDDFEETFARAGLGFGLVLKNNKSAFFMVDGDLGRDLLQTYYINAGFRWQF